MLHNKIRQYLIDFLVGPLFVQSQGEDRYQRRFEAVGYTDDPEEMKQYPVVILPSGFFDSSHYGTPRSYPSLPLREWRGIPILFGEPREEWSREGQQVIIHADLIASSYFLLSRYEEMYLRHERDQQGRFPGKSSLAYRAGFLHRPIVDEYGYALREILLSSGIAERYNLRIPERAKTFSAVHLTHDLAYPYNYRGWRSFLRAWLREGKSPLRSLKLAFGLDKEDDFYTYPRFLKWDQELKEHLPKGVTHIHFFIRMPSHSALDRPQYRPRSSYMRRVLLEAGRAKAHLGLLGSHQACLYAEMIGGERKAFEQAYAKPPHSLRYSSLAACEPEDYLQALYSGFRHDYTMGYADVVGFRLGTCHPVRFINPNTRQLTELTLHPLILRDLTLSSGEAMGLDHEQAEQIASELVHTVARYNGELTLLWHNHLLSQKTHPWHSVLYRSLLRQIEEIDREATEAAEQDSTISSY